MKPSRKSLARRIARLEARIDLMEEAALRRATPRELSAEQIALMRESTRQAFGRHIALVTELESLLKFSPLRAGAASSANLADAAMSAVNFSANTRPGPPPDAAAGEVLAGGPLPEGDAGAAHKALVSSYSLRVRLQEAAGSLRAAANAASLPPAGIGTQRLEALLDLLETTAQRFRAEYQALLGSGAF